MFKKSILKIGTLFTAAVIMLSGCAGGVTDSSSKIMSAVSNIQSSTSSAAPEYKEANASIGSTGDILMHSPILDAYNFDSKYDFHDIFKYVKSYYEKFDLTVANLELSLGGKERGYSGYPTFNCPDSILDALYDSGVNEVTAANNHCFDMGESGFLRTLNTLDKHKIEYLGTRVSTEIKPYKVTEINGIKIGRINYTYETVPLNGKKALNGIPVTDDCAELINSFNYEKLDDFYNELKERIDMMYSDGAEAIMVYIHWGDEYKLEANGWQKQIAQKLCDLGVDVIVGNHPHVIEPVELYSSEVSGKQTVCLYSLGNEVSNQRKDRMDMTTGHTEDGMIFRTDFKRNKDGSVILDKVDVLPTWVNLYIGSDSRRNYEIIPLDKSANWQDFVLSSTYDAEQSYKRTMKLVKKGLDDVAKNYVKKDLRKVG